MASIRLFTLVSSLRRLGTWEGEERAYEAKSFYPIKTFPPSTGLKTKLGATILIYQTCHLNEKIFQIFLLNSSKDIAGGVSEKSAPNGIIRHFQQK